MNINCAVDKSKYKKDRVILHSDCNGFYASVECLHHPEIRNKPVAVSGDAENRHGIILAKNEIASCKISLADRIVIDEFKNHKTLGEFILIDRVTNMTSACGVVEQVHTEETGLYEGRVDRNTRAAIKSQKAITVKFVEGKTINRAYVEEVEKALSIEGRHTYLYAPADGEAIETVVKHLHRAGLVVLLLVNEKQDKTLTGTYDLVFEGDANEEEVSRQIRSASAYEGTIVAGRDYI